MYVCMLYEKRTSSTKLSGKNSVVFTHLHTRARVYMEHTSIVLKKGEREREEKKLLEKRRKGVRVYV